MSQLLQRARSSRSLLGSCGSLRAAQLSSPSTQWACLVNRVSTPAQLQRCFGRRHNHEQRAREIFQGILNQRLARSRRVVWIFIGTNCLVFLFWVRAELDARQGRYEGIRDMYKGFTLSLDNVREGRWQTFLTSAISHNELGHLAFNMFSFQAFASEAILFGMRTRTLVILGVGSAIASGMASIQDWMRKGRTDVHGLGASGIVSGIGTAMAFIAPHSRFNIMFIPVGIPLWMLMVGYICYDSYKLNSGQTHVGHAAHLGGAAFGALFYALMWRKPILLSRLSPKPSPPKPSPPTSSPPRPPVSPPGQLPKHLKGKGKAADGKPLQNPGGSSKPGKRR
ncbi:hypothetical protein F5B20DRAFT_556639 [Whalleya microplaca]|nr:hypothetical protein F5B20DRAFT_556639 [Whalleya microplaca]